ncbi:MAG: YqhA family protein [Alphaproteobacteria bacterium]|nr:YqhA family protein [Alphaproteobacteria bacterium]
MWNRIIGVWEAFLIGCRWLQIPLIIGLVIALIIFELAYFREVLSAVLDFPNIGRTQAILIVLDLIDMVLIANLVVMVMIAGYEIFIDRFNVEPGGTMPAWIAGGTEAGELEVKIATTILLISTIHLLHAFLDPEEAKETSQLIEFLSLHAAFLLTAFAFVLIERWSPHAGQGRRRAKPEQQG